MQEMYQKYKREIIVGVVVSLITTAILKFGDWMVKIVPSIGVSIFDTISNILYSLAATYTDNNFFRMILYAGFGAFVGSVLVIVKDSIKIYKSALDVEKIVKEIPAEKIEEISDHNLRVNQKIDISNMIEKGKKSRKSAVLLTVFIIILYLYIIFFITTPMKLYNKFDQDMVKIAPYVDECMITQFKSDWVCMRSKEDYNTIYTLVDNILKENSLPD